MKKVIFSLAIVLGFGISAIAQTQLVTGPAITVDKEVHDYGTVAFGGNGACEFKVTNSGTEPLTLSKCKGSCGCTVPTTPKEPIAPGAKGEIGVHYATDRVGAFTKTVTVTSNADGQPTKVLTIKGTVLPDPAPATPAVPKS